MVSERYASITGIGTYLPRKEVTNNDLSKSFGYDAGQIEKKTGIRTRYYLDDENLIDMAVEPSYQVIRESGLDGSEIQRVFFLFETPLTERWDNHAGNIQKKLKDLGINLDENNFLNIPGGCSEYVDCLKLSTSLIESGRENNIIIVTSANNSIFLDRKDEGTSIIFGDGASATLVQATKDPGFLRFYGKGIGDGAGKIYIGPDGEDQDWKIRMDGKAVYRFAVNAIKDSIDKLLEKSEYDVSDIDKFILHQANKRIIDHGLKKLGIPPEKAYNTIEKYGNTGVSSIGITLNDAMLDGFLKDGDKTALVGFGAGLKLDSSLYIHRDEPMLID